MLATVMIFPANGKNRYLVGFKADTDVSTDNTSTANQTTRFAENIARLAHA